MKKYTEGELLTIPDEIVERMLEYQVEQCNFKNSNLFAQNRKAAKCDGGFFWPATKEGYEFWYCVLNGDYNLFFQKYPKKSEYPKVMWVWDYNIEHKCRRIVFMEKNGGFLAWLNASTFGEAERINSSCFWRYAEDIEEPIPAPKVNITIEEIAKAFGLSTDQVSIVEKSA